MTGEPPAEGSLDAGALLVMGALAEVDPPGGLGEVEPDGVPLGVGVGVVGVLEGVGFPLDVEGVGFGGFVVGLPETVGIPSGVSLGAGFPPGADELPGDVLTPGVTAPGFFGSSPGLLVEPSAGTSASRPFSVSSSFAD